MNLEYGTMVSYSLNGLHGVGMVCAMDEYFRRIAYLTKDGIDYIIRPINKITYVCQDNYTSTRIKIEDLLTPEKFALL